MYVNYLVKFVISCHNLLHVIIRSDRSEIERSEFVKIEIIKKSIVVLRLLDYWIKRAK